MTDDQLTTADESPKGLSTDQAGSAAATETEGAAPAPEAPAKPSAETVTDPAPDPQEPSDPPVAVPPTEAPKPPPMPPGEAPESAAQQPKPSDPSAPKPPADAPESAVQRPQPSDPSASKPPADAPESAAQQPKPSDPSASKPPADAPEAPAEAPEPASGPTGPDDANLFEKAMADLESDDMSGDAGRRIKKGDRIKATVIQVEKDRVFVNLGTKAEAVVPLEELTDERVESAEGMFSAGDTFDVIVLRAGGPEGAPVVSKRRADFDNQWQKILDSFDEGTVFQAQVVDRVKGGLVVDIGVRGFVPATHVGSGRLRNIERFVGQTLPVKIIEIDRDRKKVVLSNRSAEDERRSEAKQKIFGSAQPQDVLPGVVRRLTDYGAFVDLGGIDGLLHISEMSWVRIDHPREVLKEGDEINVMILRLDPDAGRISLGLRQVLPDPWNQVRKNYKRGQKIHVQITRLVQSGAFVRLPEGAEAFMPVSEMSNRRIKKPTDAVEAGQEVEATILDLRPDERRMVLSLRDGAEHMHRGRDHGGYESGGRGPARGRRRRKGGRPEPEPESGGGRSPSGGATIGERIGMLKGILPASEAEAQKKERTPRPDAPEKDAPSPARAEPARAKKAEPKSEEPAPAEPQATAEKPEEAKAETPKPDKPAPAEPQATAEKPEKSKTEKPKPEAPAPSEPQAAAEKPEKPKAETPKPDKPAPAEPQATAEKPEKPKAEKPKPEAPAPSEPQAAKPQKPKREEPGPAKPRETDAKPKAPAALEPKPEKPKTEAIAPVQPNRPEPKPDKKPAAEKAK